MFDRLTIMIGNESLEKIKDTRVVILGIGGVGGYTVEALARSGVGNIVIIDKDQIEESNINRQIIAYQTNIGNDKVDAMKERIKNINPECNVTALSKQITINNVDSILDYNPNYVVDACDDIKVKKALISLCVTNNIKIISSMGMGNKMDPSKIKIVDIRKTAYDPIARIIRKFVKDEMINTKIPVVYSEEIPIKNNSQFIGSCSFVPSVAGLFMASYIIRDIVGDINEIN